MDVTFNLGQRCFVLRPSGGDPPHVAESQNCQAITKLLKAGVADGAIKIREDIAWQILSDRNVLRTLRSEDGGALATIRFEPASGTSGSIVAAVSFDRGWLVEWHSGPRRWLVLHSVTGKPLSTEMALPNDGELFASQNYDGLHFLKLESGKPAELIIVPAAVEWSRTLE